MWKRRLGIGIAASTLLVSACVGDYNKHALELGVPPTLEGQTITSLRAVQSRSYETLNKGGLVQASAATLQDLGFNVDQVSKEYGVLVGSKQRDAVEAGQVAVQFILVVLAGLAGSQHNAIYDESQKINVTVVVNELDKKSSQVRVFFDRHITNNYGELWKAEVITQDEIYRQFFEKLSKSAFFEEHKL